MASRGFKFDLGETVRDKVSGFEGIVVTRGDHVSGCDSYGVQTKTLKDGAPQDLKWFDEPRLEAINVPVMKIDMREQRTGADSVIPSAAKAVGRA